MRLRILPLVIFIAFTSVVVKVFDIIEEKANVNGTITVSKVSAIAEDSKKAATPAAPEKDAKKVEAPAAPDAKKSETPEAPAPGAAPAAEGGAPDGKPESNKETGATLSPGYLGAGPKELQVTDMSDMEKNLLENLAKRRKELDEWSASIAMKENILNATEKKIDSKMEDLKKLEDSVKVLLEEYNKKEDEKVKRLVKIYESMKPQDAANIFEKMDMEVLLGVVSKMKEDKAGKVLAKMSPDKAKELTTRLAQQNLLTVN
jgi:flagellar motility protein MotE (MotC chaperone)